jgi:hypothetical protein
MHDLVDTLRTRLVPGAFVVLCVAWDGWTLLYPDRPGGMDPRQYERVPDVGGSDPAASAN